MSMLEELKRMGVDTEEGLDRVVGDASLYEMMLGMFVDSVRDNPVRPEDFAGDALEETTKRVHMLKGVTGNLAITPLFDGYTQSLTLLRAGQAEEARAEFERLAPLQAEIIACIKRYQGA